MSNGVKFIVLVEDDAALRRTLTRLLEARGYFVLGASSFREAAELLTVAPALLVLDIYLPDATGWDILGWLTAQGRAAPVVVISGAPADARQVARYHPAAFLAKPFAAGDFLRTVGDLAPAPIGSFGA
jgi:DNA-binding response OmpR family regulator